MVPEKSASPRLPQEIVARCREVIRVGSKSFSFAATLFPPDTRDASFLLYAWCRHCDDAIDAAPDPQEQVRRLGHLRAATTAACEGRSIEDPTFLGMGCVTRGFGIHPEHAFDLLDGMEMDVRKQSYRTLRELKLYCYRVAGTVGLMMAQIMGVSRESALGQAVDLGIAMQLTNIARDVAEDFRMGRIYLPLEWLEEKGIDPAKMTDLRFREPLFDCVRRLLAAAEEHYRSGNEGLRHLPLRAAIAVAVASEVYARIGRKLLSQGPAGLDRRTIVGKGEKFLAAAKGIARALSTLPGRLISPWKRCEIRTAWRYPA